MDDLLPYYERELVMLRQFCREFSERFPETASRLYMSGDTCDDPHIERLIQASALLASRLAMRLDSQYPEFTEGLLETLLPHTLRVWPSSAIAQLCPVDTGLMESNGVASIPRGAELESAVIQQGVRCKFRTAYDLLVAPIIMRGAKFSPLIQAPAHVKLPANVTSGLSIVIESRSGPLAAVAISSLRVFINGAPSFCGVLRDALFMRVARAFVEDEQGIWTTCAKFPITPVGFADEDALIPFSARTHPARRVLTEYFAFPEKFNFFDLDLSSILPQVPAACRRLTLHLALTGMLPDSDIAHTLSSMTQKSLLLGCTPVVNLFKQAGVPIATTQPASDYAVLPHATRARAYEVYSIDSVQMERECENEAGSVVTEFLPYHSLRHGEGDGKKGNYWVMQHDDSLVMTSRGHVKRIKLVDIDFAPLTIEKSTLSIALTCTNGDLPCMLEPGRAQGDFMPPAAAGDHLIRLLHRPSQPCRYESGSDLHWQLISNLTLNHHALVQDGLPAFRDMLALYDLRRSPTSQRQIDGIVGLAHGDTAAWIRGKLGVAMRHGTEVRVTLDEAAFPGGGMHLFVQVIDQFLELYVHSARFIELLVLSKQTGTELIRCQLRMGALNFV